MQDSDKIDQSELNQKESLKKFNMESNQGMMNKYLL